MIWRFYFYKVGYSACKDTRKNRLRNRHPVRTGGGMGRCPRFFGNGARFLHFKDTTQINAYIFVLINLIVRVCARNVLEAGLRRLVIWLFIIFAVQYRVKVLCAIYRPVSGRADGLVLFRTASVWRALGAVESTVLETWGDTVFLYMPT